MRHDAARVLIVVLLLAPTAASAYVGPGLGAGAVAAVLGVLGSLALGLFAVIYYPIKRALRGRRRAAPPPPAGSPPSGSTGTPAGR